MCLFYYLAPHTVLGRFLAIRTYFPSCRSAAPFPFSLPGPPGLQAIAGIRNISHLQSCQYPTVVASYSSRAACWPVTGRSSCSSRYADALRPLETRAHTPASTPPPPASDPSLVRLSRRFSASLALSPSHPSTQTFSPILNIRAKPAHHSTSGCRADLNQDRSALSLAWPALDAVSSSPRLDLTKLELRPGSLDDWRREGREKKKKVAPPATGPLTTSSSGAWLFLVRPFVEHKSPSYEVLPRTLRCCFCSAHVHDTLLCSSG